MTHKTKKSKIKTALFLLFASLLHSACHPGILETISGTGSFADVVSEMAAGRVKPGETVGVVAFYDSATGDYTALGDQWRERVSSALTTDGVKVKVVRDLDLILNYMETTKPGFSERKVWRNSGRDYLLAGNYFITKGGRESATNYIELNLKLLRVKDLEVAGSRSWRTRLQPGWQQKSAIIRGNKYQKTITVIGPGLNKAAGPPLKVNLDRENPCYPAGAKILLTIKSAPGIYLYILNVAADNSVTLNYPNRYMQEKALVSGNFIFPPPDMPNFQLELYPLPGNNPSREAFKIIASYNPLDFSFLKVAEGRIFAGAEAAELKEVLDLLKNAKGYSETSLNYMVGRCR